MPSRKKLSPLALVALLFFACTIVYGLLSSYPRQLACTATSCAIWT